MKIAVTGSSGFIGRHVLAELSQKQVEITLVTRDAKRLLNTPVGVNVVEMDIALPGEDSFIQMGSPDVLIHLAWGGLPNYKSLHHFESELQIQYHFIKTLIESGLSSVLITGTCFEYGMQSGPLSEDVESRPNNPYGYAKDALRKQLEFLKQLKPFSLTWARLFYMFGEGQSNTSLYTKLKEAVSRGETVFDLSGGEQLRDYLYVTEVARTIVRLALSGSDIGTVNICSGKPVSVRRLVEQWLIEHNWEIKLNFGHYPYPDYEPMAFWGDATKLQKKGLINCD